jgi:hypothetical protein
MPVHAIHDVLADPPPPLPDPFALTARRITDAWLDSRDVTATPDDLRLAAQFLQRAGMTVDLLPGLLVRIVSARGHESVVSREAAVMTAIRRVAAVDVPRPSRSIARAA